MMYQVGQPKIRSTVNTKIEYMYRDANNYKAYRTIVLTGVLTASELTEVKNKCDWLDGDPKFIASEVGLPSPQHDMDKYGFPTEADHVWCELLTLELASEPATKDVTLTAGQLRAAFAKAKWDETAAMKELGWDPMTL